MKNSHLAFRSKFEEMVHEDMSHREIKAEYEPFKIDYTIPEAYKRYTPDFVLENGICIECKGWFPLDARKKMIFVRSSNPHLDIRFVFMDADHRLQKKSSTTLGEWATKHKFMWARETVPQSWVDEKESICKERDHREVDHRIYFSHYGPYSCA